MSEAVTGGGLSGASADVTDGISRELKDRFHEAIDMAVNPGGQKYAKDGVPQCVIGCYAAKYAPEAFKRAAEFESGPTSFVDFAGYGVYHMLQNGVALVPSEAAGLAIKLQREWDQPMFDHTLDMTRARLHALVEAA